MFAALSTPILLLILAGAAGVVLVVSVRMTDLADALADRLGWGEAIVGGVVLGAATSLSGLTVSVSSAWGGDASLAVSNGLGGIAAQTLFLAVADVVHRRANLEHASAEIANLFQGVLLMTMLTLPLVAWASPPVTLLGVHPVTVVMIATYAYGLKLARDVRADPMWHPKETDETRHDEPDDDAGGSRSTLLLGALFAGLAVLLCLGGLVIAQVAAQFTTRFGLSSSLVGALMTAVLTSLPELVTTITAVRRGALQLAVGGIIGGNTFDTLFLAGSDIAYREGSVFHAIGRDDLMWLGAGLLMTALLVAGQIRRQKGGPGNIGFESAALFAVYGAVVAMQALAG